MLESLHQALQQQFAAWLRRLRAGIARAGDALLQLPDGGAGARRCCADVDPHGVGVLLARRGASALLLARPHDAAAVFALDRRRNGSAHEQAFKILKAGISWPTNIVNMRHPEIFEDLIKRRGAAEENEGTIRHGVAASTTMAMDITPNHPVVKAYLEYKPKSTDPKVQALWQKLVHEPVYRAVNRYQPILKRHKMLDQVFRFQDLDALVDRLEASENPRRNGIKRQTLGISRRFPARNVYGHRKRRPESSGNRRRSLGFQPRGSGGSAAESSRRTGRSKSRRRGLLVVRLLPLFAV